MNAKDEGQQWRMPSAGAFYRKLEDGGWTHRTWGQVIGDLNALQQQVTEQSDRADRNQEACIELGVKVQDLRDQLRWSQQQVTELEGKAARYKEGLDRIVDSPHGERHCVLVEIAHDALTSPFTIAQEEQR